MLKTTLTAVALAFGFVSPCYARGGGGDDPAQLLFTIPLAILVVIICGIIGMNVPKSPTKRTLQQQAKLQQQADEAAKQLDAGRMKLAIMMADQYTSCGHDAARFFHALDSHNKGLLDNVLELRPRSS